MNKIKVLVVDDSPDMRLVLIRTLKENNFPCDEAQNGLEAYEKIMADSEIKLILLDLLLPDISGIELLEKLTDIRKLRDFKVCIISGKRDRETVVKAIQQGVNDFMVKPIYPDALIAKINSLFQLGNAVDQYQKISTTLKAKLGSTPIEPDLIILTVSEVGMELQSSAAFEMNYKIELSCAMLSNASGLPSPFHCRVTSCKKISFGKYNVQANFIGVGEEVITKIRALAVRGVKISDESK